jgi:hypothetical protein
VRTSMLNQLRLATRRRGSDKRGLTVWVVESRGKRCLETLVKVLLR